MAAPVKMRGRIKNGIAEIKSLMPHPMETGTRRNADGELVPAHYIQTVTCFKNDEQIMQAHWGPAVSKNPFFSFKVKNAAGAWCDRGARRITRRANHAVGIAV